MYPIILKIGPITIYSYGLFIALGFMFGILVAVLRAKNYGLTSDIVLDMAIYALISAIIGSRLLYVIVNYNEYFNDPIKIFYIHKGGLVFYGGLIGVILTLSYYIIKHKLNYFKIADFLIISLPIGHFFGRIGCFLNGCCYGAVTNSKFGIIFPNLSNKLPRHPTQLYEAFFCLISFFLLILMEKFLKLRDGMIFITYIYMYSIWRFFIEFVRDDERGAFIFNLSPSQIISIFGVLFATICLNLIFKNKNNLQNTSYEHI